MPDFASLAAELSPFNLPPGSEFAVTMGGVPFASIFGWEEKDGTEIAVRFDTVPPSLFEDDLDSTELSKSEFETLVRERAREASNDKR